jgi:hypothetical protein
VRYIDGSFELNVDWNCVNKHDDDDDDDDDDYYYYLLQLSPVSLVLTLVQTKQA